MALTLMSAGSTENNLLYLLFGAQGAALLLSAVLGRRNVGACEAALEVSTRVFCGAEFPLRVVLSNKGRLPAMGLLVRGGSAAAAVPGLLAGESRELVLRERLAWRGLNRLDHLVLESSFPVSLITFRRPVAPVPALAFPRLREIRAAGEVSPDVDIAGHSVAKKGLGDELYGVRAKEPGDDAKFINWKLSAKTARPMVNEFCAAEASRLTIRLSASGAGPEVERRISETASALRYHIDAGAEVRLVTAESELGYGKGLLHLDRALELLARFGEGKIPRSIGAAAAPAARAVEEAILARLLYLIGFLVCGAMFLIEEINPKVLWALLALPPIGLALHERRGPRLPKAAWDAMSLAALIYLTAFDWRASGVVIANTHLISYLIANRALSEFKAAEIGQTYLIYFLGFFLVSGLSISPWYFVFFLLFAALSGLWLMLAAGCGARELMKILPWLGGVYVLGLAAAAVIFMATPRVERLRRMNPFIAMGTNPLQMRPGSTIGFSEEVSLGFFGSLKKSTARVARVRPEGASTARPAPLRLRGAAYDFFDGRRWRKSRQDFRYRLDGRSYGTSGGRAWARRRGGRLEFPQEASAGGRALEFTFQPLNLSVLFTGDGLSSVETSDAAYFDFTDTVYFAAPYIGGTRYRAAGGAAGFSGVIGNYDVILKERFLQLPKERDSRVAALARRITAGLSGDQAKARAVESYVRKNFAYSTYSAAKQNSLADFLFASKRGNCEYFATAAAILLRHAGVPTRLATGFVADDWNEYGKYFDVRQGQAHAWTEAYVAGRGWLTLEPTPAQGAVAEFFTRRWERYFDALQAGWYRNVIGYDNAVQRNTFFRLGRVFSPESLTRALKVFLGLALAAALLGLLAGLAAWFGRGPKARGFFERAQEALGRAGLIRHPGLTPREFAAEVAGRRADLPEFSELVELHYLDRYSPGGLSAQERLQALSLLAILDARIPK